MKINPISFGQTFINSTFQNLSDENKTKMGPSIAIGEYYPMDIYLGAKNDRDVVVQITRASEWDYLMSSGEIEPTEENIAFLQLQKAFEYAMEYIHSKKKYPVEKFEISNLDKMDSVDIINRIADAIDDYHEKYKNLFEN
ncbi:hypothetical protein IKL64_02885 [bacterium]|nr:hypothetical protein [bacterium]